MKILNYLSKHWFELGSSKTKIVTKKKRRQDFFMEEVVAKETNKKYLIVSDLSDCFICESLAGSFWLAFLKLHFLRFQCIYIGSGFGLLTKATKALALPQSEGHLVKIL